MNTPSSLVSRSMPPLRPTHTALRLPHNKNNTQNKKYIYYVHRHHRLDATFYTSLGGDKTRLYNHCLVRTIQMTEQRTQTTRIWAKMSDLLHQFPMKPFPADTLTIKFGDQSIFFYISIEMPPSGIPNNDITIFLGCNHFPLTNMQISTIPYHWQPW